MSQSLATVAYIGAAILFILSLGGLSNPETSRRGNLFGMLGMALAVSATVFGPRVSPAGMAWIVGALVVGGGIGLYAAKVVKMTQMPELVALMHSLSAWPPVWWALPAMSIPLSNSKAWKKPSMRWRFTSAS